MKLFRGMGVKWQSRFNESRWFNGVIRRMFYSPDDTLHLKGIAVVDDGSGMSYRCIPQTALVVTNDPTRIKGLRK